MDVIETQIVEIKSSLNSLREQLDQFDSFYTPEKFTIIDEIKKNESKLNILFKLKDKILKES